MGEDMLDQWISDHLGQSWMIRWLRFTPKADLSRKDMDKAAQLHLWANDFCI